eukprot:scaffold9617_cov46-Attheya_sp.AAC.1
MATKRRRKRRRKNQRETRHTLAPYGTRRKESVRDRSPSRERRENCHTVPARYSRSRFDRIDSAKKGLFDSRLTERCRLA